MKRIIEHLENLAIAATGLVIIPSLASYFAHQIG